MKTKTIRQTVTFKASPHAVFETLIDSKKHSRFTGAKATISRKVSGKFSAYGSGLHGTNLELVKDKKIVQAWACKMNGWPNGHFSKAVFSLRLVNGGTKLFFTQTGVPAVCYSDIKQGWTEYYWKPMKDTFGG